MRLSVLVDGKSGELIFYGVTRINGLFRQGRFRHSTRLFLGSIVEKFEVANQTLVESCGPERREQTSAYLNTTHCSRRLSRL